MGGKSGKLYLKYNKINIYISQAENQEVKKKKERKEKCWSAGRDQIGRGRY